MANFACNEKFPFLAGQRPRQSASSLLSFHDYHERFLQNALLVAFYAYKLFTLYNCAFDLYLNCSFERLTHKRVGSFSSSFTE